MTSAACIAATLTAGIVLAACSDDARMPGADDDTTAQPIRFTAVCPAPITTRAVAGNDEWKGDGTERIGVELWKPGAGNIKGTYTITDPDGTATALAGDQPLCWPDKGDGYDLNACYPLPGTYNISDQSTSEKFRQADFLAVYDLSLSYAGNTPISLKFGHRMTKVRVELEGNVPATEEIKVEIWSFGVVELFCDRLAIDTKDAAYITACRDTGSPGIAFEAMVPSLTSPMHQDFIRITIGGKVYHFTPSGSPNTFEMGHVYTYHVTI